MRRLAILMGLAACGGPNEETLIAELRVVAAVAEPPAAEVGQTYRLTFTVADPKGLGGDWLAWTCIPDIEEIPVPAGCIRQGGALEGETITIDAAVVGPLPVYFMACNPGACDLAGATDAQLEDPDAWLQDLPFTGVALARRFTRVLEEGAEVPTNPVIEEVMPFDPTPTMESNLPLSFIAPGAETAYGYATAGGFDMTSYDVGREGNTELVWVAPEDPGPARLYVVLEDGEGGAVVWTQDVDVGG